MTIVIEESEGISSKFLSYLINVAREDSCGSSIISTQINGESNEQFMYLLSLAHKSVEKVMNK